MQTTWKALTFRDQAEPADAVSGERSVQIGGEFATASVVIEGSNDGDTFFPLHNPDGVMLARKVPALDSIREVVNMIRPVIIGGTAKTKIDVTLVLRVSR